MANEKLEKLLEDMARAMADELVIRHDVPEHARRFESMLKRRLLPLLEAGQAMREKLYTQPVIREAYPTFADDYDAALAAALRAMKGDV